MRRHTGALLLAIATLAAPACAELKGLIAPGPTSPEATAATTPFTRTVTGQVRAVPGLTVQAVTESPLVNAEVYLADGTGQPLPAMTTRTNAQGRYVFTGVPAGYTFLVVAKTRANGKEALLQSLVHTTEAGAKADVDATTTLVSVGVLQELGEALGAFDPAKYQQATAQVAARLKDGELPDFSDRAAVRAKIGQLQQETAELKASVEAMRGELKDVKVSLADLKTQLAKREADLAVIAAAGMRPSPTPDKPKASATPATEEYPWNPSPTAQEHAFFAYPGKFQSNDYPIKLEFRKKGTTEVTAKLTLIGDNKQATAKVVHDEPYDLWASTQRQPDYAIYWGGYVVPEGAEREVALPFAAKENPLVEHTFKLPATKFAETDFPVTVEFREKGGPLVIAKAKYEAATDKPTAKIRHGMAYDLWVSSKTQPEATVNWHGWTIPESSSVELTFPFK